MCDATLILNWHNALFEQALPVACGYERLAIRSIDSRVILDLVLQMVLPNFEIRVDTLGADFSARAGPGD